MEIQAGPRLVGSRATSGIQNDPGISQLEVAGIVRLDHFPVKNSDLEALQSVLAPHGEEGSGEKALVCNRRVGSIHALPPVVPQSGRGQNRLRSEESRSLLATSLSADPPGPGKGSAGHGQKMASLITFFALAPPSPPVHSRRQLQNNCPDPSFVTGWQAAFQSVRGDALASARIAPAKSSVSAK